MTPTTESQTKQIHDYLIAGNSLTALEALALFKCWRLASRIYDISRKGIAVKREMVLTSSGKRIAKYSIQK